MSDPAVDAYLAAQSEPNRALLEQVRAIVRELVPDAVEVISYSMPGYRLRGKLFISFAGYKAHCALYPATEHMKAELGEAFAPFVTEKATIRFSAKNPLPEPMLRRIVELLAEERAGDPV
jgi:uncharacterized protein YdhG (YjbR/CyaY superfamily)